jgi:4-amino-4-deoxy-L-arabinose transferase-like glycosyltransferase
MRNLSYTLFRDSELLPIVLVCAAGFVLLSLLFHFLPERNIQKPKRKKSSLAFVKTSIPSPKLTKKDFYLMSVITFMYAAVSFWRLGSMKFPVTTWQPASDHTEIILETQSGASFDAVYAIYNEGDNNANPDNYQLGFHEIEVEGSDDMDSWQPLATLDGKGIFEWKIIEAQNSCRYIRIISSSKDDTMTEFALRKADHSGFVPLTLVSASAENEKYPASFLIDEQELVPMNPTYYEEAYFDEVYHPRNAWEIAEGQRMYATVHPLFGTNLMALSIKLLGLNPFAWRLPGALTGVLMIPLLYVILKQMFRKTFACACGAVLLAADFMHLTTSRIGTLEPFSVFFILWMFLYMIRYVQTSFYDTPLKKQLTLLFVCGGLMGIAIATKWTGCYSAVGLALLLFASLFRRFYEYRKAGKVLKNQENYLGVQIAEAKTIRSLFVKNTVITLACCILFFIIIPLGIYCLSYLPDKVWGANPWSVKNVGRQILYIYRYHRNVTATHPYQSVWWMWLLDIRPIWYHQSTGAMGWYHTISCFSNPLLCLLSLPAILFVICDMIREKRQNAWIIFAGYLTALGPWLLVDRCVFSYHFYPTSLFAVMAIVYVIDRIMKKAPRAKTAVILVLALYVLVFVLYLPATAGFGTSRDYINGLELLGTWHFG